MKTFAAALAGGRGGAPHGAEGSSLDEYLDGLVHEWSKTLAALAFTLVPLFFILDAFMMPKELLTRFGLYRLVCTAAVIGQYFVIRHTRPGRSSKVHGYVLSFVVGGTIALMTTDLGGFNSTYYAGLNLVLIAVCILLPAGTIHSACNSLLIIGMYVGLNLLFPSPEPLRATYLINNMYFLVGTAVIAVSINYVKQHLIRQEWLLRSDLRTARDALWGEMEVAKQIQTSLLPKIDHVEGYEVAATMVPADEVGGDYYDIISETAAGESWISIGDVSGHGVESGLIMMMTQTSIFTTVNQIAAQRPSRVLGVVNAVMRENVARLGSDRYMTLMAMVLHRDHLEVAGKHQDLLVYRRATAQVEVVSTVGTWIGVVDDLEPLVPDTRVPIAPGDIVLLFTDGVTEAMSKTGEMYGQERLERALVRYANLAVGEIVKNIIRDVQELMDDQGDDITVVALRRAAGGESGRVATPRRAGDSHNERRE